MSEATTITIYIDTEVEALVKAWAAEDDRSVSSFFRRLIEAERVRRMRQLSLDFASDEPTPAQVMENNGADRLV